MLDISQFITEIRSAGKVTPVFTRLALALNKVVDAVNQTANGAGVDSTQMLSPPDAPQAINVKAANGTAHVTITDNSQRSRALHYFVEADTTPSFAQPHVFQLGAGRGAFLALPGLNDDSETQQWYFRAYSSYPGSSKQSAHQVFGGAATPTAVTVGGSVSLTPLPSTGAGTASTTGQRGGTGFGPSQFSTSPTNAPP